eukprot:210798_1
MGTNCSTRKSNRKQSKQKSSTIKTHRKTKTRHKTLKPPINNHTKKDTYTLLTLKQISFEHGYWQCDTCTYINAPTTDNCMVCQLHQTTTDSIVSVSDSSNDNALTIDRTTMHQVYTWQFLAKNNEWTDLDMSTVLKLEALNINDSMNYCFGKYTVFKLSDFKCIQYNNSTDAQRQLRRIYIDENRQNMNKGNIYFQYGHYTKSQIEIISAAFNDKFNQYPLSLLCVGYWRLNGYLSVMNVVCHLCESYLDIQYTSNKLYYDGLPKLVFGGMLCVFSQYNNTFGYEITTSYKNVGFDEWSKLIVKEFEVLRYNLLRNGDIVIPIPPYDELRKHHSLYHEDMKGKQVINHRIGIENESLPFRYRLFIQGQIDELKYYAMNISVVEQQLF